MRHHKCRGLVLRLNFHSCPDECIPLFTSQFW